MIFNATDYPPDVQALLETQCPDCGMFIRIGDWYRCPHDSTLAHGATTVIDDSIPGGMTVENFGPTPETFYSKSDWKRRMKELGLVQKVQHRPMPGSDRSPHTTRWI